MNTTNIAFAEESRKLRSTLQEFEEESQEWQFNYNSIKFQTRSSPMEPSFSSELHGRSREGTRCFSNLPTANPKWIVAEEQTIGKRKASDNIDLSLSLGIRTRQEEAKRIRSGTDQEEVDSNLSLSCSSYSKKGNYFIDLNMPSKQLSRFTEENNAKSLKLASTLDLTI